MKTQYFKILSLFIALVSINTNAQISENSVIKSKVLLELKFSTNEIKNNLYVEKVLPHDNSLSVVVVPKISTREIDEFNNEILCEFDTYILLVENSNGNIISKFFEPNAWVSDAIFVSSIEIDTAPYILNSNTRAFGIRVNYQGSSRANPYNQSQLSLFVLDGRNLNRVLNSFSISEYNGEWDTNCEGQFESTESVIIVDKKKTNGFCDIVVKRTYSKFRNELVKDDCVQKITKESTKTKRMKYNGLVYK